MTKYCSCDDVPTEVSVHAVNTIFDPPIDEAATLDDDREPIIEALTEKGITLEEIEELETLG